MSKIFLTIYHTLIEKNQKKFPLFGTAKVSVTTLRVCVSNSFPDEQCKSVRQRKNLTSLVFVRFVVIVVVIINDVSKYKCVRRVYSFTLVRSESNSSQMFFNTTFSTIISKYHCTDSKSIIFIHCVAAEKATEKIGKRRKVNKNRETCILFACT